MLQIKTERHTLLCFCAVLKLTRFNMSDYFTVHYLFIYYVNRTKMHEK